MSSSTETVELAVPRGRAACAAWLKAQPPATVADVLAGAELLHGTVAATSVEAACREATERKLADQAARHGAAVKLLEAQLGEAREDVARAQGVFDAQKRRLDEKHARERDDLSADLDACKEKLEKLQGKEALRETALKRAMEEQLARERASHERALTQLREAFDKAHEKTSADAKAQYAQQLKHMHERYADQAAHQATELARCRARLDEMQETTYGRVETLFGSLCGNSAKKGDVGEEFVQRVHSELQLGVLARTGRLKCAGYADHAWEWEPPAPQRRVSGIVEVKFSQSSANATRDVHKFKEDVREAAASGRANVALYVSLVDRIHGKPKISMEILHGIPVLWAGRNVADDLSAAALVEMAFSTVAGVWGQLTSALDRSDAEATLHQVHAFLTSHLSELDALEKQCKALESASHTIKDQVSSLRESKARLVAQAAQFRTRHLSELDALCDAQTEAHVRELLRAHYARRGRLPQTLAEWGADAPPRLDEATFQRVRHQLKESHQKAGAAQRKKRKGDDEGEEA